MFDEPDYLDQDSNATLLGNTSHLASCSNQRARAATLAMVFALLTLPICISAQSVDYERDVKPLLKNKCYACHGRVKQEAGLRLDAGKARFAGWRRWPGDCTEQ